MTGFEACRQLRRFSTVPVLFLTARGEEIDRVVGFEIGADDYVVKPFSPREVVARVRAVLKRSAGVGAGAGAGVGVGADRSGVAGGAAGEGTAAEGAAAEFSVDAARLLIHYRGQPLKLTALEFRLLQQLLAHPQQVQDRGRLLAAVGIAPDAGYAR